MQPSCLFVGKVGTLVHQVYRELQSSSDTFVRVVEAVFYLEGMKGYIFVNNDISQSIC